MSNFKILTVSNFILKRLIFNQNQVSVVRGTSKNAYQNMEKSTDMLQLMERMGLIGDCSPSVTKIRVLRPVRISQDKCAQLMFQTEPVTFGELCRKLVMNMMKTGIVAGAIYWTFEIGLWSDSKTTERLYVNMYKGIADPFEGLIESKKENTIASNKAPHLETVFYNLIQSWNRTVLYVFGGFSAGELYVEKALANLLESVTGLFKNYESNDTSEDLTSPENHVSGITPTDIVSSRENNLSSILLSSFSGIVPSNNTTLRTGSKLVDLQIQKANLVK